MLATPPSTIPMKQTTPSDSELIYASACAAKVFEGLNASHRYGSGSGIRLSETRSCIR